MNETGSAVATRKRAADERRKKAPAAAPAAPARALFTHGRSAHAARGAQRAQAGRQLGAPAGRVDRHRTGKLADTFNDVVELNERMAEELARLSQRRRQGRQAQAARRDGRRARLLARSDQLRERADRRPRAPDFGNGARDRRRGAGRPVADDGAGGRRPAARRANSCAPPRRSTRWWTSSARSPPK